VEDRLPRKKRVKNSEGTTSREREREKERQEEGGRERESRRGQRGVDRNPVISISGGSCPSIA
jgi:hypothetical protein